MTSDVRRLVVLAVCLMAASPARAQQEIDDARKAKLHFSGIFVTPTFELKEFGLDTNVFNQTGQQNPDFTTTVAPGVKLDLPFAHRALVTAHVDTDFVYFAHYVNERSINPNVTVRATGFFHRLTVFTEGGYLNTHQRPTQEIDARARRIEQGAGGGVSLRLMPKVSIEFTGRAFSTEWDPNDFFRGVNLNQALTSDSRVGSASIKYRATPLTTFAIRADADAERFRFDHQKDADNYSIMPGVEFKPRALVFGTAYVGVRDYRPLNPIVPEYRGLTADLMLGYSWQSATTFTVQYSRGVQSSYQDVNPYYVSTLVGLLVRRELVGPFDTTVGAQRYNYAYQDLLTSPLANGPQRIDATWNYTADIGYRVSRKGRVAVGVSYWDRGSNNDPGVAYQGFRFGTTFNYGLTR